MHSFLFHDVLGFIFCIYCTNLLGYWTFTLKEIAVYVSLIIAGREVDLISTSITIRLKVRTDNGNVKWPRRFLDICNFIIDNHNDCQ